MALKQISLSLPETLFDLSREYSEEYGYRTVQEFIVELLRKRVILENVDRYKEIEERMKKGVSVKKYAQKDAIRYVKSL